jgi:hypothetical protein
MVTAMETLMTTTRSLFLALCLALTAACDASGPRPSSPFAPVVRRGGPQVVWDVSHQPLPEIPLPNDQATRLDPTSPTGRRLNISTTAKTRYESRTRAQFNRLDGFGAYGPVTARFSKALDLGNLVARHQRNLDFRDDAVFLFNVDPRCSRFGEEVALDFGRGRFPVTLMSHSLRVPDARAPKGYRLDESDNRLFAYDPEGESSSVMFNQWNEDLDGDGQLGPGEDRDGDGVLDVANFVDPTACDALAFGTPAHDRCIADHLMSWYERETNTLIARPVWPLEERCTYAVVFTNRLVGADALPVESPFALAAPREQLARGILLPCAPAPPIEPLMDQHTPVAGLGRGWSAADKRHPRRRRVAVGEGSDLAGFEGLAETGHRRRAPAAGEDADGLQAGHQQEHHQGEGQGRQHHPRAAAQQHAPLGRGSQLQGQKARQRHQHRRALNQACRQIRLHRRLQTRAHQLQQAHQPPLLQRTGFPQLQAGEQGDHHGQGAQQIHGPQGQEARPQQAESQPLQQGRASRARHGASASRSRQRSRWARPSSGPTTSPCQSKP